MAMPPTDPPQHLFAGPYLDRGGDLRKNPEWVAAALAAEGVRFVPVLGAQSLVRRGDEPGAVLLTAAEALPWLEGSAPLYLGRYREQHCFALELREPMSAPGADFVDLRLAAALLGRDEAGLLAYARALVYWRARHRYCGACGSPAIAAHGGQVMTCSNPACGAESFPRLDPAIIALVTDGARALLGRQASWPAQRYSTLAGFVEPGESLEDAVVREVAEEARVVVTSLRYHSSQPWPFPSSLMVGFIGTAHADAVPRAGDELEDARWFSRDELACGAARLPPRTSISYALIRDWYDSDGRHDLEADLARRGDVARW